MATGLRNTLGTSKAATPPRDRRLWTYEHAQTAAVSNYPGGFDQEHADSVYAYIVLADHYQEGAPWIGAGFDENGNLTTKAQRDLKKFLTPHPESFSCLTERVDGSCRNEASITIAPREPAGAPDANGVRGLSKEQEAFRAQWLSDVSAWWTAVSVWGGSNIRNPTGVRGVVAQASASKSGAACLRFYINPAARTLAVQVKAEDGTVSTEMRVPKATDRAEALKHIRIVAPPPDRCAVYTDPDTHDRTGVFLFTDSSDRKCAEVWFADGTETVMRTVVDGADAREDRFPWGANLAVAQADIGCILTPAVLRLQAALDLDATSLTRLIQAHGFGQRTEINAHPDGEWKLTAPVGIDLPEKRQAEDGTVYYFHPAAPTLGPDIIRQLSGFPYTTGENEHGPTSSITTPSVDDQQPSPTDHIITGADAHTMMMRYACRQGHRRAGLSGSTAEASGEAYEQARAGFKNDINGVAEAVDAMLAEFVTAVTVAADWFTGSEEPTFVDEWIVQVQSHPSAGTPSTQAQAETRANVEAEMLSPEEGIARLDVQDVPAEITRIAAARTLAVKERRWNIAIAAAGAGFDRSAVLEDLGFEKDKIAGFVRTDGPPNIGQ